jgi:membrane associated rhomboid family serine protease
VTGALLLLGLQAWPGALQMLGFFRPAYEQGAVWQLLTAQFVHLGWPHASVNAGALAISLLGWQAWVRLRDQLLALAGGLAGVALLLAWAGSASYYAGLSGALHGLWAGCAAAWLACPQVSDAQGGAAPHHLSRAWQRGLALAILSLLAVKLWLQDTASPESAPAWLDIPVYPPAHWAGLAGGLVAMGLASLRRQSTTGRHGA